MKDKSYTFRAKLWLYPGQAAWHFVSLPDELAANIRILHAHKRSAWGSIKVTATIGKTKWQTSIFADKRSGTYLLPVKAEVRKREGLKQDMSVGVSLALPEQLLP
ncbi:MAG: DUF1905 domain-containing protein [Bradyrhizobium sp.]|uniref:DUF1905 domain-containing protein n=1 Tax=Bradyrhizobium sp. TaxID=376 RepID=UPI0025C3F470|nr:DUF1905 domain-containing protein [Bradyrhizobium sp.]MBI5260638.1 DUF1905 domain-containing protein [Bradyrhizobium sp.]